VELLPDEPIVLTYAKGMLTVRDFAEMFETSRKRLQGMQGPIYRISDFREASSSFIDLIRMAQLASKGGEGTTSDPRIKVVLIGTNQWVSLARTIFEQPQYSNIRFPTFETMEEGLHYARTQLSARDDNPAVSGK